VSCDDNDDGGDDDDNDERNDRDNFNHLQGLPQKYEAFERFLETYPEYRGRVVMLQIAGASKRFLFSSFMNENRRARSQYRRARRCQSIST